jgi:hypothetical protein
VPADATDDAAVRAAGVLAEKGYWMWTFQAPTRELTSWGSTGELLVGGSRQRMHLGVGLCVGLATG